MSAGNSAGKVPGLGLDIRVGGRGGVDFLFTRVGGTGSLGSYISVPYIKGTTKRTNKLDQAEGL